MKPALEHTPSGAKHVTLAKVPPVHQACSWPPLDFSTRMGGPFGLFFFVFFFAADSAVFLIAAAAAAEANVLSRLAMPRNVL